MAERKFQIGDPIAYFITWTSYGTWLPGDERGWWRKGGEWHSANSVFREMAATDMKETQFLLSWDDRDIVEKTVARHCEIRNWQLHAVQARTNHVHVVVTASGYESETVSDQFKAWCTRKLKPTHPGRKRFWSEGGWRCWICHEDDLEAAIVYVNEAQDRKGKER